MRKKNRAVLVEHEKLEFDNGDILEMKIWAFEANEQYPEGVKYGLIYIQPDDGKRVLMDNHFPKGHHYHLDDQEYQFEFQGVEQLLRDFKKLVKNHLGVKL